MLLRERGRDLMRTRTRQQVIAGRDLIALHAAVGPRCRRRCKPWLVETCVMDTLGAASDAAASLSADRSEPGFVDDVRRAVEVCRATPTLPALTTLLAVAVAYSGSSAPAHTAISLVGLLFIGWVGSERLWFLHAYDGRSLSVRSALRVSLDYWPRVMRLTLLLSVVTVPLGIPILVAAFHAAEASGARPTHVHLPVWALIYSAGISLLIDFILTFVTPALIYTNRSARSALRIGVRLLRQTWPHAAPYVLIPPLALVILSRLTGDQVGWLGGGVIVMSYLLNLVAKGATASFYLRHVRAAGPDGDLDRNISPAGESFR